MSGGVEKVGTTGGDLTRPVPIVLVENDASRGQSPKPRVQFSDKVQRFPESVPTSPISPVTKTTIPPALEPSPVVPSPPSQQPPRRTEVTLNIEVERVQKELDHTAVDAVEHPTLTIAAPGYTKQQTTAADKSQVVELANTPESASAEVHAAHAKQPSPPKIEEPVQITTQTIEHVINDTALIQKQGETQSEASGQTQTQNGNAPVSAPTLNQNQAAPAGVDQNAGEQKIVNSSGITSDNTGNQAAALPLTNTQSINNDQQKETTRVSDASQVTLSGGAQFSTNEGLISVSPISVASVTTGNKIQVTGGQQKEIISTLTSLETQGSATPALVANPIQQPTEASEHQPIQVPIIQTGVPAVQNDAEVSTSAPENNSDVKQTAQSTLVLNGNVTEVSNPVSVENTVTPVTSITETKSEVKPEAAQVVTSQPDSDEGISIPITIENQKSSVELQPAASNTETSIDATTSPKTETTITSIQASIEKTGNEGTNIPPAVSGPVANVTEQTQSQTSETSADKEITVPITIDKPVVSSDATTQSSANNSVNAINGDATPIATTDVQQVQAPEKPATDDVVIPVTIEKSEASVPVLPTEPKSTEIPVSVGQPSTPTTAPTPVALSSVDVELNVVVERQNKEATATENQEKQIVSSLQDLGDVNVQNTSIASSKAAEATSTFSQSSAETVKVSTLQSSASAAEISVEIDGVVKPSTPTTQQNGTSAGQLNGTIQTSEVPKQLEESISIPVVIENQKPEIPTPQATAEETLESVDIPIVIENQPPASQSTGKEENTDTEIPVTIENQEKPIIIQVMTEQRGPEADIPVTNATPDITVPVSVAEDSLGKSIPVQVTEKDSEEPIIIKVMIEQRGQEADIPVVNATPDITVPVNVAEDSLGKSVPIQVIEKETSEPVIIQVIDNQPNYPDTAIPVANVTPDIDIPVNVAAPSVGESVPIQVIEKESSELIPIKVMNPLENYPDTNIPVVNATPDIDIPVQVAPSSLGQSVPIQVIEKEEQELIPIKIMNLEQNYPDTEIPVVNETPDIDIPIKITPSSLGETVAVDIVAEKSEGLGANEEPIEIPITVSPIQPHPPQRIEIPIEGIENAQATEIPVAVTKDSGSEAAQQAQPSQETQNVSAQPSENIVVVERPEETQEPSQKPVETPVTQQQPPEAVQPVVTSSEIPVSVQQPTEASVTPQPTAAPASLPTEEQAVTLPSTEAPAASPQSVITPVAKPAEGSIAVESVPVEITPQAPLPDAPVATSEQPPETPQVIPTQIVDTPVVPGVEDKAPAETGVTPQATADAQVPLQTADISPQPSVAPQQTEAPVVLPTEAQAAATVPSPEAPVAASQVAETPVPQPTEGSISVEIVVAQQPVSQPQAQANQPTEAPAVSQETPQIIPTQTVEIPVVPAQGEGLAVSAQPAETVISPQTTSDTQVAPAQAIVPQAVDSQVASQQPSETVSAPREQVVTQKPSDVPIVVQQPSVPIEAQPPTSAQQPIEISIVSTAPTDASQQSVQPQQPLEVPGTPQTVYPVTITLDDKKPLSSQEVPLSPVSLSQLPTSILEKAAEDKHEVPEPAHKSIEIPIIQSNDSNQSTVPLTKIEVIQNKTTPVEIKIESQTPAPLPPVQYNQVPVSITPTPPTPTKESDWIVIEPESPSKTRDVAQDQKPTDRSTSIPINIALGHKPTEEVIDLEPKNDGQQHQIRQIPITLAPKADAAKPESKDNGAPAANGALPQLPAANGAAPGVDIPISPVAKTIAPPSTNDAPATGKTEATNAPQAAPSGDIYWIEVPANADQTPVGSAVVSAQPSDLGATGKSATAEKSQDAPGNASATTKTSPQTGTTQDAPSKQQQSSRVRFSEQPNDYREPADNSSFEPPQPPQGTFNDWYSFNEAEAEAKVLQEAQQNGYLAEQKRGDRRSIEPEETEWRASSRYRAGRYSQPPPYSQSSAKESHSYLVNPEILGAATSLALLPNYQLALADNEFGLSIYNLFSKELKRVNDQAKWKNPQSLIYCHRAKQLLVICEYSNQSDGNYELSICRFNLNLELINHIEAPKYVKEYEAVSYTFCHCPKTDYIYFVANTVTDAFIYELNTDGRWTEIYHGEGKNFTSINVLAYIEPVTELIMIDTTRDYLFILSFYNSTKADQRYVAACEKPTSLTFDERGHFFVFDKRTSKISLHSKLDFIESFEVAFFASANTQIAARDGLVAALNANKKHLRIYKYY